MGARKKLITVLELDSLKPKKLEYIVSCGGGLSVRVLPSGIKQFQCRFRPEGEKHPRRFRLGNYPDITLEQARELYFEERKKIKKGNNPIEEKLDKKIKQKTEPTVKEAYVRYQKEYLHGFDKDGKPNLKRPERQEQYFRKDILPLIGKRKAKSIDQDILVYILDQIKDRGAPIQANRTLSALKMFFKWCSSKYSSVSNPTLEIEKRFTGGRETRRKRYLKEHEIKTFFQVIDTACFSRQVQLILKILILTGQRVSEVCNSEWAEVDFENRIWIIPAEKSKNGDENKVPMTDMVVECFQELKLFSVYYDEYGTPKDSRYVCQTPKQVRKIPKDKTSPYITPEQPILYTAINRAVKRRFDKEHYDRYTGERTDWIETFDEKWVPHDLRRSVSTQMNEIGVLPHVVEAVLNHRVPGVEGTYNHAKHVKAKREALEVWQEKIRQIITGEKIISLQKKQA